MIYSVFYMLILIVACVFFYGLAKQAEKDNARLRLEIEAKKQFDKKIADRRLSGASSD